MESLIRDSLLAKQPEAYDWFWSEQIPAVVTTFVNYFEKDQRFAAATAEYVHTERTMNPLIFCVAICAFIDA